jgi:hypothetical protein
MSTGRIAAAAVLLLCAVGAYSQRTVRPIASGPRPIGGTSPFTPGCGVSQSPGTLFRNSVVEPYVAADPRNPLHLVGVWQQDRWSDGEASGVLSAVSMDGGASWTRSQARFSNCTGGVHGRASDPWAAVSPDGTAYQIALTATSNVGSGILVSRSADGGFTWGDPTTVVLHPDVDDDKESITADPADSRYVYAVWDHVEEGLDSETTWFSRTTDGGKTWEPARVIYDPGPHASAFAHQILVLGDGSLLDIFASGSALGVRFLLLNSQDHGETWSAPVAAMNFNSVAIVNPKTQAPLRTGAGSHIVALDRASSTIYLVWQDGRFSGSQREGIAFSKSVGGRRWSTPVQINQAKNVQAFTPSVAVAADGTVAVTYYDFRHDTDAPDTLLTSLWKITSHDGGATWRETAVDGPFDILKAPLTTGGPFLGDYQGLAASGNRFVAFYATPAGIFASFEEHIGGGRVNPRVEINLNPRSPRTRDEPERKRK